MKRSTAILLAVGLVVLIVGNSAHFFFHQPYYEFWDTAPNSLAVDRAKHFSEMYGHYSRWVFRHPGPAFFYVDAFGEWLFYDTLHIVPAPYNAHLLINLCLMVGFYVTALRLFTLWLLPRQRGEFLFLALALGVMHFGSMAVNMPTYDILRGSPAFLSTWPVHVQPLPLLCLLTAAASVAAGRGQHLPLLALVDGFLVHCYITQPLFVVPVSLLAYAGLLAYCAQREAAVAAVSGTVPPPVWRRTLGGLGAAWRAHRGAHLGALALALFFALPPILDLFRGADSHLTAILTYMRVHQHEERKTLARSLMYLLQFGAYTGYSPNRQEFGFYDAAGAWTYLHAHALVLAAWAAAAALACWAVISQLWSRWRRTPATVDSAADAGAGTTALVADRRRFLAWAAVFLALAFVLTLYWGTVQVGAMYFYNAVFNFGIYYFLALIAVAVLTGWPWLAWLTGGGGWQGRPRMRTAVAVALLALLGVSWADRFRLSDPAPETTRAMHEAVSRVLAATAPPPGQEAPLAIFSYQLDAWPTICGLALEMKRAGRSFAVKAPWWVVFNEAYRRSDVPEDRLVKARVWRFELLPTHGFWEAAAVPLARQQALWKAELDDARTHPTPGSFTLLNGVKLTLTVPAIDPASDRPDAADIRFTPGGNAPQFMVAGWSIPEGFGAWSDARAAIMRLQPVPVSGEAVALTVEGFPFLRPEHGLKVQRLRVLFDGEALGPDQQLDTGGLVQRTFTIPAARWNHAAAPDGSGTALVFEFPDAVSPDSLIPGAGDNRVLGLGFHALRFRVVPTASAPAATPQP